MDEPRPLQEIFAAAGGITAFAEKIGVDRTTPYAWTKVPAHHARKVAEVTGIPRHEIRPDLYEAPTAEAAA